MELNEVLDRLNQLPEAERKAVIEDAHKATANDLWIPNPGPQTEAYFCEADLLLFGGSGGGGKSDLGLGLAFSRHKRSLLMRRQYTDLGALIDRAIEINGTRKGFNGAPPPRLNTVNKRLIDFGAAKSAGDEDTWQGNPHDLLDVDEAVQWLESQIRFLMGWVRSTDKGQRKRTILSSNPPLTAEGRWIIPMFGPWLDPTHPKPAKPGDLRWFLTDPDGKDMEVDGPDDCREWDGKINKPQSRTFIPASLRDNPFLIDTGYQSTLDALPEPLRSAIRDGNFMAAVEDRAFQVIPTNWIVEAQNRWHELPPAEVKMCAMGCDMAQGGTNDMVIAPRYDGWFAPMIAIPGRDVPTGRAAAAEIIKVRRDRAVVIIDMGGGYGSAAKEHLENNGIEPVPYVGAGTDISTRTNDGQLKFFNKRSEAYWRFREALDPDQQGGSPIFLPDDPMMVADLTAPDFEVGPRGIQITKKEKLTADLGRSPDRGDAAVMAWSDGLKNITGNARFNMMRPDQRIGGRAGRRPKVLLGHRRSR